MPAGDCVLLTLLCRRCRSSGLERTLTFDPKLGEVPEGIAIDARGNLYVSLTPLGQLRRIAPSGEQKVILELGMPGLTGDRAGSLRGGLRGEAEHEAGATARGDPYCRQWCSGVAARL